MRVPTNTHGGKIDHRAIIGHAPESRNWVPGMRTFGVGLGLNVRVEPFATIDAGMEHPTLIGARTWVFKHAHVGHDCEVGEDCEISTGAIIGGHCKIGNGVRIGIGAVLRPWVKVGDGARIGCGAVVVKDVPAGEVWVGNPAHAIRREALPEIDRPLVHIRATDAAWTSAEVFIDGKPVYDVTKVSVAVEVDKLNEATITFSPCTVDVKGQQRVA